MCRFICLMAVIVATAPVRGDGIFWSSARGWAATPPHQLHLFDENGLLLYSVDQVPGAQESRWGYRDGMTDRSGHIYFGWEDGLARHNLDGSGGIQLFTGPAPGGVGVWRALAFDPTGDGGNGSIWTQSFNSPVAEIDLSGNLLQTFPNPGTSAYGLAYDDSDGNLWVHSTDGEVVKMSTATGQILPGGWPCGFPNFDGQGGLSAFHDGSGWVAALSQGTPDELGVYDSATGILIAGPWDLEIQTGSGAHLGVAVVPEPGVIWLVGLGTLAFIRRR